MSALINLIWLTFYWPLVISLGIGILLIPVGVIWWAISAIIYRNN
mgnify:CR=1 FL=1|tara:strand:+ start:76 stop:210 length:135 start_codon:yes stop_codon:yes gene_type:complete